MFFQKIPPGEFLQYEFNNLSGNLRTENMRERSDDIKSRLEIFKLG